MTLPDTYNAVRDRIDARASSAITLANNRLQHAITTHVNDTNSLQQLKHDRHAQLNKLTLDYLYTGIARLPDDDYKYHSLQMHGSGWGHMSFSWWRYFKDMAKELRRPLVTVNTHQRIAVQKFAYTRPLVAQFLLVPLVARPVNSWNKKYWTFWISENDWSATNPDFLPGMVLLEHWLQQCKEDPDMRRALRLP